MCISHDKQSMHVVIVQIIMFGVTGTPVAEREGIQRLDCYTVLFQHPGADTGNCIWGGPGS